MNNGFEQITIPKFIDENGIRRNFQGYLRDWEPNAFKPYEDSLRFFDVDSNYYGILIDRRKKRNLKSSTLSVGNKKYYYKIISFHTFDCKVNPENGHLLVPHECGDPSCRTKIILFGKGA